MLSINQILVARDFSSVSDRALRHAFALAARTGATLHVLHAQVLHEIEGASDDRPSPAQGIDALRHDLKHERGLTPEALDQVSVVEVTRRDVQPAPAVLRYAAEEGVDLIALGTHGRRGPSRVLLGSVAEEVVRRADRPVLTVRGPDAESSSPPNGSPDRILVPVDFSQYAREALRTAHAWAELHDARLDVLHVVEEDLHPAFYVGGVKSIYDVEPDLDDKVRTKLQAFVSEVTGDADEVEMHVATGAAAAGITEFVEQHDTDLAVLSTHGRTGLERFLLGSVSEKVVRHVRCPVLTVKAFGHSLVSESPASTTNEP